MGNFGNQPEGQVLFADQGRAETTRGRGGELGESHCPGGPLSGGVVVTIRRGFGATARVAAQAASGPGTGCRDPGPPGTGGEGRRRARTVARRGPPRRSPQLRRNRTDEGRASRPAQLSMDRNAAEGSSIRAGFAAARAWLHRCCRWRAGARHRSQCRHVQRGGCRPPEASSVSANPTASFASGKLRGRALSMRPARRTFSTGSGLRQSSKRCRRSSPSRRR